MASKAFPDNPGRSGRSFFSELQNNIESDEQHDAGQAVDEENLREDFQDYDLENGIDGGRSRMTLDSAPGTTGGIYSGTHRSGIHGRNRNRWQRQDDEEEENDVPESLLMEPNDGDDVGDLGPGLAQQPRHAEQPVLSSHRSHKARGRWDASRSMRKPHRDPRPPPASRSAPAHPIAPRATTGSARDKAAWRWVNVSNLDQFMLDVYNYYDGCGIWCILTDRGLHLL